MPEAAQAAVQAQPSNPLGNAQSEEARFEQFWQSGAFDSQNPQEAAQLRAERGQSNSAPESASADPGAVKPDGASAEATQEQTPEYADLDEYLTKAGLERDAFLTLPAAVQIDGQVGKVSLKEALDSYQREAHFTRKSQQLADERRSWESEREQAKQALTQRLNEAQSLGNLAHQQLLAEFQSIDWNKLRMENPGEWAVRNQEFNLRAAQIQNHLAQVAQQQQQLQQQTEKEREARLPKEFEAMYGREPALRDPAKFEAAKADIRTYANQMGLKPEEISQASFDHRLLLTLHYASQYLKLQAAAPQALKRVQAAPKAVQPGARVARDPKANAAQAAKDRWMRNPRDPDAQAAYAEHLIA
jgi:hypothetical protein